jgi:hypothetical protein
LQLALDRVRDARGDDAALPDCEHGYFAAGGTDTCPACDADALDYLERRRAEAARSPQDEDHEDCPFCGKDFDHEGYCEVPSPSRVGSVAVKDALKRLVELKDDPDHDNIDPIVKGDAWRAAREALAQLSRSSTDRPEQPEPDVLGGRPPAEPAEPEGKDERRP